MSLSHQSQLDERKRRSPDRVDLTDLDAQIAALQQWAMHCLSDKILQAAVLSRLADLFDARFQHSEQLSDLQDAVAITKRALDVLPNGHSRKAVLLSNLNRLQSRLHHRDGNAHGPGTSTASPQTTNDESTSLDTKIAALQQWAVHCLNDELMLAAVLSRLSHLFGVRFQQSNSTSDLTNAVRIAERVTILLPSKHPRRTALLDDFRNLQSQYHRINGNTAISASSVVTRGLSTLIEAQAVGHMQSGEAVPSMSRVATFSRRDGYGADAVGLDAEIKALQQKLEHVTGDKRLMLGAFSRLSILLCRRFELLNEVDDITNCIQFAEWASNLVLDSTSDVDKASVLNNLGTFLEVRFDRLGDLADLDRAIQSMQRAVTLTPDGHPDKAAWLSNLGVLLTSRFGRLGGLVDLDRAIQIQQQAIALTPDGHSDKLKAYLLNKLGDSLQSRFDRLGEITDLDCAIRGRQRALILTPDNPHDKARILNGLSGSLLSRFNRLGELADLDRAIQGQQYTVALTPDGHSDKASALNNLSSAFRRRFDHLDELADLDCTIQNLQQAITLTPDSSGKANGLNDLGCFLYNRFSRLGELADLDRAIQSQQCAVALTPDGHADKADRLNYLGNSFHSWYCRLGELADLVCAIQIQQRALALTPVGHAGKPRMLSYLGTSLRSRFDYLGELADLDRAIQIQQQAVTLTPDVHRDKASWLNNLGASLQSRFDHLGDLTDLDRAIQNMQWAVALNPDDHRDKTSWLSNLSACLYTRFIRLGELNDLDRAIESQQWAVDLTPDSHAKKAGWLNNLGLLLESQFHRLGELADLERAIEHQQRAVALTPDGHADKADWLDNLGNSFHSRFGHLGELADLDRAIQTQQQAVDLTPDGSIRKAHMLNSLGTSLHSRFSRLAKRSDLDQAISLLARSAELPYGSSLLRVRRAWDWAHLCVIRRQFLEPDAAIKAFTVLVGLIPRITSLGRTILQRYNDMSLANIRGAMNEAIGEAIHRGKLELAIEWLEQSRSIIWAQVVQLRSPIDNLRQEHPAEANKLETLSRALESAATSDSGGAHTSLSVDAELSLEAAARKHRRLGEEYEKLLERIRMFNGFDAFLKPKSFTELREATSSGPVVIIALQAECCNALILHPSCPTPTHMFLFEVRFQESQTLGSDSGYQDPQPSHYIKILRHCVQLDYDMTNLFGPDEDKLSLDVLEAFWEVIAEPVLGHLGFLDPPQSGNLPRVTWCITGILPFLPIHAAGRYREVDGPRVSDLVVSSYTPTLTALLGRKHHRRDLPVKDIKMLGVSQPKTPGLSALPYTRVEIDTIQQLRDSRLDFHWLNDADATVNHVLDGMKQCEWIHLACHGTQNGTESAFHLADGKLTLQHIMKHSLPHAELAVLSACQTAMGDKQLPEESLHLAAGMLIAGYDSVVATIWYIADSDGPIVAKEFYRYLMNEGGGDSAKSAYALHHAVKKLREVVGERDFDRWVPFIHLGV